MRRQFSLLLLVALVGAGRAAVADEPVMVVLARMGPNPGDTAHATLLDGGHLTLHAVRTIANNRETFDRSFTLAKKVLAALVEDLAALKVFDLPPPAEPLGEDEAAVLSLEMKRGEQVFKRAYGFRHLYEDLPDHAVLLCLERYFALDYWVSDHLLHRAEGWLAQGPNRWSTTYARLAIQVLTASDAEECDRTAEAVRAANDMEKKGDLRGAWAAYLAIVSEVRARTHEWRTRRGIGEGMEKARDLAPMK